MAETSPENIQDVYDICHANEEQIAAIVGQAFEVAAQVTVGESTVLDQDALPDGLGGPGLLTLFQLDDVSVLLLIPHGSLLPDWCSETEADSRRRLLSLAGELAPKLLPDAKPEEVAIAYVANLSTGLERGDVANGAAVLSFQITAGDATDAMYLVWPAPAADKILELIGQDETARDSESENEAKTATGIPRDLHYDDFEDGVRYLPQYSRSLLRIKVPVVVKLAASHEPIKRIMELGPGTMIQFEKSCEEMLDLEVGNQRIAIGEAVKVGDKFGLRVTSMVMPHERFTKVTSRS